MNENINGKSNLKSEIYSDMEIIRNVNENSNKNIRNVEMQYAIPDKVSKSQGNPMDISNLLSNAQNIANKINNSTDSSNNGKNTEIKARNVKYNNIDKESKINNIRNNEKLNQVNIKENQINNNINQNSIRNINNESSKIKKRKDIHYKFNLEAANELREEYEKAPIELTEKWRKSKDLKDTGLSEVMKKGPFSNEEKEALKKAVYDYLEMHGIEKSLVLNLIFKKQYKDSDAIDLKKHQGFWKYVSQVLPNRSTESSYRCVTRMFHPDNFNGKFTEKDDEIIMNLYAIYGPSWKKIGEMIGRMGTAVKDRHTLLQKKSFTGTGAWTKEENKNYIEIVNDMKNKNQFVNGMPVFSELSRRLQTRSPKQCYVHWAFTKEDFIEGKKYPFTIFDRQEYLEKLQKLKVQDETQVDWKKVANPHKPWKYFMYSKDWTSIKNKFFDPKDTRDRTFSDCVKSILKLVNEKILKLIYDDGLGHTYENLNEDINLGYQISQNKI